MRSKRINLVLAVTICAFIFTPCAKTFATVVSGYGNVALLSATGSGNIVAESYSLASPIVNYQIDNSSASTSASNASGAASSLAMAPYYIAFDAHIEAEIQANDSSLSRAWASIKATNVEFYSGQQCFYFIHNSTINVTSGSQGFLRYYVGLWEGLSEDGDFILTPKDGWSLVNIGTQSNPFNVLSKTFYSSTEQEECLDCSFTPAPDAKYSYYVMIEAQVIPEPATMLLLALGGVVLRRKK